MHTAATRAFADLRTGSDSHTAQRPRRSQTIQKKFGVFYHANEIV